MRNQKMKSRLIDTESRRSDHQGLGGWRDGEMLVKEHRLLVMRVVSPGDLTHGMVTARQLVTRTEIHQESRSSVLDTRAHTCARTRTHTRSCEVMVLSSLDCGRSIQCIPCITMYISCRVINLGNFFCSLNNFLHCFHNPL